MWEWIIVAALTVSMGITYYWVYKFIDKQVKKINEEEQAGKRHYVGVPPNTPWYNHPNTWIIIWLVIIILMLIIAW
ncbi:MAG: hypothetical protein QXE05_05910 [Nitrososphaeria archaeon]